MDLYHAFFDLKPGVTDMQLVESVNRYMGYLCDEGLIASHRLTRAKLGFGLKGHGDWHLVLEVRDLAQLQAAFDRVASRRPGRGVSFRRQFPGAKSGVRAVSRLPRPGPSTWRGAVLTYSPDSVHLTLVG
jgi:hypothetical protein